MSRRGVVGIDRDVFNHPAFKPEPFPEAMAWIWLICEATHKTHLKRIDGHPVELHRGQLSHSIRFMGMAWLWSKSRVDRFLSMLENRDMIRREIGTKSSVITICNYDVYQRATLPARDNVETPSGTKLGQSWDKLQNTENTEDTFSSEQHEKFEAERRPRQHQYREPAAATKPSRLAEHFDRFRAAYPKRDGSDPREPARKKFEAAVRSGADPEIIIRGAELFAQAEARRGNAGSRFIPHSATWLNKRQWEDHLSDGASSSAPSDHGRWRFVVSRWQADPQSWDSHAWGPAPREPGCRVPLHILDHLLGRTAA